MRRILVDTRVLNLITEEDLGMRNNQQSEKNLKEALSEMYIRTIKSYEIRNEVSIPRSDFSDVIFDNCSFVNVKFNKKLFQRAKFVSCSFVNVDFSDCDFSDAKFDFCYVENTTITGSTMSNTVLLACTFDKVTFSKNRIINSVIAVSLFESSTFRENHIEKVDMSSLKFKATVITDSHLKQTLLSVNFEKNSKLTKCAMVNCSFGTSKWDLSSVVQFCKFTNCRIYSCISKYYCPIDNTNEGYVLTMSNSIPTHDDMS